MKLTFTLQDLREITFYTYSGFVSTFKGPENNQQESEDLSNYDSYDPEPECYGCDQITDQVERLVDQTWHMCKPLDEVYGTNTANYIKNTVTSPINEEECFSLFFFEAMFAGKGEKSKLTGLCTEVAYWCCCETIKKVSPILRSATVNLFY